MSTSLLIKDGFLRYDIRGNEFLSLFAFFVECYANRWVKSFVDWLHDID
jgi:hypothetical protein